MIAVITAFVAAMCVTLVAPSQAHAASYTGTVHCTGGSILWNDSAVVGIWIDQPGGRSGWASFTKKDKWSAEWSYDFKNDAPYQIRVGCGGTPQAWQTTNRGQYVKPSRVSHDYICNLRNSLCSLS
ncbi:MAG: hypothetical protein Q4F02_03800 [Candidatus Saccharibacteria bacterium]|nr:hypothetical protein [Candidatus Saccharibacteria bacterium]